MIHVTFSLPRVRRTESTCKKCGRVKDAGVHEPLEDCTGGTDAGVCSDPSVHHVFRPRRLYVERGYVW